ncbi:MAG: helix-turn-helix domain-containing protein [Alphaproteobacteria bacterium]
MDGLAKMNNCHHYTGCGLDYVYLANGFTEKQTEHGPSITIEDMDGLHDVIAMMIIASPRRIRGQELRYLRSMLGISQGTLAKILDVTRSTIARWEGKPSEAINGPADRLLRLFYALEKVGHARAKRIVKLLKELDELEQTEAAIFKEAESGWEEERQAA